MTLIPETLDEIDFWDLEMFERGDPHAAWRLQRDRAPVWWHDRPGGEPFWSVARFDDALTVLGDPLLFSSERDGIVLRTDAMLAAGPRGAGQGVKPMIHTDPPRHALLRKLVSHNFRPRSVAKLEEEIRRVTVECLTEAADTRELDFVNDVAHRIPAAIALSLMGVPEEKWARLAELEHMTVASSDPEFTHGKPPEEAAAEAGLELHMYFAELVQERMQEPGDDLLSQFVVGRVEGEQLPWQQVVAEAGLLLAGGLDTTRAAASAGALLPLIENPDQQQVLRDDPSLISAAVDEFVRWASPITSEARTVTADTELGGQQLREGDDVMLFYPSANRDDAHFTDPDRFDIRRDPNHHIAFGFGHHFCLGNALARLELTVFFDRLLDRLPDIEVVDADTAPWRASSFITGHETLTARFTPC